MSFDFVRDVCRNVCKKKFNFVSGLFIIGLFVLVHVSLLNINRLNSDETAGDKNSLSKSSVNSYEIKQVATETQKEGKEIQETTINCNKSCVEEFIDNFLFADDEANEEQSDQKSPKEKSGSPKERGRGHKNKKTRKHNIEKSDKTSEASSIENLDSHEEEEFFLPTRTRGMNQDLYKEDTATNFNRSWTREMAEERQKVFKERIDHVSKACQKLQQNRDFFRIKYGKIQDNLRWVQSHKFIWCPIFKSASTTWVKYLLLLAGQKYLDHSLHGTVRELFPKPEDPRERNKILKESMKILIVRHPLERLLSAYRDKMLRVRSAKDNYVKIQEEIVLGYADPRGFEPTKSQGPARDKNEGTREYIHPTFSQFLLKVRDDLERFWKKKGDSPVNLHWRPYWSTCDPCQVSFDVIAQVETLDQDQEYIIRELGLQDILFSAHTHASNFDSYNGTSEATQHYYSQVPLDLLKDIIDLYKPDFELFDYSPQLHINIAKKNSS